MNKIVLLTSFMLTTCSLCFSQIRLPRLVSDGMVLQRDARVKIWGWAAAGEKVKLSFKQEAYNATADNTGKWSIELPPQKAGGPYNMVFSASNKVQVNNILVGDVWICSGQSNMELTMERVKDKYADIVAAAADTSIRQFLVPDKYDFNGQRQDVEAGQWLSATTENILSFSAVGYFFARTLSAKYHVPIGLINAALGGSPAEAWISEDALKQFPDQYHEAQKFKDSALIARIENNDNTTRDNWYSLLNQLDDGLRENWSAPAFDDAAWQQMSVPGYWADNVLGNVQGAVWFRKMVEVPASLTGKPVRLLLGRIVDADSVYVNGAFVGATSYQYPPRKYVVPSTLLKPGKNLIAVRVINNAGKGGFVPDKPYLLAASKDTIHLEGTWKYRLGAKMAPLPSQTFIRWKPTGLFNAMIAPLLNYSIKGVIWYQGEANTGNPAQYTGLMTALINDWRTRWKQGSFPFIFVQLANFMEPRPQPSESDWAELRQAQLNTLATVPRTGMAVAIDLGEWNDIHPLNKQDVGKRLALEAMRLAYGATRTISAGPLYKSKEIAGNKITLTFTNTGSGLVAADGEALKYFTIAGPDKKFLPANARIAGNKVIVWNDAVSHPVAVRYAWADNPAGANLYNKEGLPASPFETGF